MLLVKLISLYYRLKMYFWIFLLNDFYCTILKVVLFRYRFFYILVKCIGWI